VDLEQKAIIYFGSGKLEGFFGEDTFYLGSPTSPIFTKEQTLGFIKYQDFIDPSYDAIIGLAYPSMADVGLPIFDMMME